VTRKVVLAIVDGLTPTMLEASLGTASAPWLSRLVEHGSYRRGSSVFPSLTPVCLSSIATGSFPDVHEIPHLVWYHRGEKRLVEYGSSFGAMRAAGARRAIRDTIVNMNADHLGRSAVTFFEALADAGLRTAAVNFTAYRGRTLHRPTVPFLEPFVDRDRVAPEVPRVHVHDRVADRLPGPGGAHGAEGGAVLDQPPLAAVVPDEVRDLVHVGVRPRRERGEADRGQ